MEQYIEANFPKSWRDSILVPNYELDYQPVCAVHDATQYFGFSPWNRDRNFFGQVHNILMNESESFSVLSEKDSFGRIERG